MVNIDNDVFIKVTDRVKDLADYKVSSSFERNVTPHRLYDFADPLLREAHRINESVRETSFFKVANADYIKECRL